MKEILNKKAYSVMAALLLGSTLYGADGELQNRVDKLEKMVQDLAKENQELKASFAKNTTAKMSEELKDVSERMDEVEMLVFMDKVKFQVGFQTRLDNYAADYADGTEVDDSMLWTNRMKLDMFSDVSDDLSFNGRLSMYKYWADSDTNYMSTRDAMQGRRPGDSSLYVERAYVDWTMLGGEVPLILTLGRQPGADGPSHQFKDNTVRKSTYSALAFDGGVDGAVLTANLAKATALDNTAFRLVYGKGFQAHDNAAYTQQVNYTGTELTTSSGDELEDTVFTGFFIDSSIPGVENTLLQIGYVKGQDFVTNDMMYANMNGMNDNIGDISVYGLMAEATNLLGSGLDLFAHYGVSESDSNGRAFFVDANGNGAQDMGEMTLGLMSSDLNGDGRLDDTGTQRGHAFWAGLRYTLPFKTAMKVGYEYNYGSENWFPFTYGSNDLTNKLAARGDAHEIYLIHEIGRYANLRAGATIIDYDYTGSGDYRGVPMKISSLPASMKPYFMDKLTNYYLLFNLFF